MSHDLMTLGEAMLRLWVEPGSRLEDAPSLRVGVAGAEANVAIAVARMGHSAAFVTRLPDSPLGRRAAREIGAHGVDLTTVRWVRGERLGAYFVELASPPRSGRVIYDRAGSAAASMTVADIDWGVLTSARVVHLTGITPALSSSCREVALEAARRARRAGCSLTVDLNYRRSLWEPEEAKEVLIRLCQGAEVVLAAERDLQLVFGLDGQPRTVVNEAQEILRAGSLIMTRGDRGSVWRVQGEEGETPAYQVRVVDRVGSGDAFAAGVIVGLLQGDLEAGIAYGTAMAALTLGWEGDQFWGDMEEVERLLSGSGRDIRR